MKKNEKIGVIGIIIATAVITAFVNGTLGTYIQQMWSNAEKSPNVQITQILATDDSYVGRSDVFQVTVTNIGNDVAQGCMLYFNDGTNQEPITYGAFGMSTNEPPKQILVTSNIYKTEGVYNLSAYVTCQNNIQSKTISQTWKVPNAPQ